MKKYLLLFLALIANQSFASLESCSDLYVGQIITKKGIGLERFSVVESVSAKYGSDWIYAKDWNESSNALLSTLLSAKMAGKKVELKTEGEGCGITSGNSNLEYLVIQSGQ